jgi:Na+/melibiose symporter-like transporter
MSKELLDINFLVFVLPAIYILIAVITMINTNLREKEENDHEM